MQYLPIYPEKSWLETVATPMEQFDLKGDWGENLPLSYQTARVAVDGYYENDPARMVLGGIAYPFMLPMDALGTWGNTAYNGYKRLYNYGANAYNNLADYYNNWQSNRHMNSIPTRLTGRKITTGINPALYNLTLAEVEKPIRYLANDGQPVAKIVDPNPYQIKVVPAASGSVQLPTARDFSNVRKMAVYNGYLR